jgi:uncharacterized membrane protein
MYSEIPYRRPFYIGGGIDMADVTEQGSFAEHRLTADQIKIRKIGVYDLWQSLKEGYDDFRAKPSHIPFLILMYALFAVLWSLYMVGHELRYQAFPMVAGFNFLGPVVLIVLFEMSRRRERGLELRWGAAFGFIHSSSFAPILALSIVMMLLYVGWLYMAELIYFGLFGDYAPASMPEFIREVFTTRHGGALLMYGNLVGFLFAFTALSLSVVAFPLILDKPVTSFTAMAVSVKAVMSNISVMALWGLIVVAFLTLGATLFLIGLAVALPVLGHATWHLYRKIVE